MKLQSVEPRNVRYVGTSKSPSGALCRVLGGREELAHTDSPGVLIKR
ncbi:MAG: hypothetical protein WAO78_16300 [Roseovarius sp.]